MRDLLNLPDEVRARLRDAGHDLAAARTTTVQRGQLLEARPWASLEVRAANADGSIPFVGYSTSYEKPYPVWGGPDAGGWFETMAAGSWAKTINERDDIRLLVNHEGVPLARTKSGTLLLESDDLGVLNATPEGRGLDPASPLVATVVSAMRRGDLDQMSCAFQVVEQQWSPDWTERRIVQVRGFDSSIVTYPANEATMALVGAGARAAVPAPEADGGPAARAVSLAFAREQWARAVR